jgi:hypothetical protein
LPTFGRHTAITLLNIAIAMHPKVIQGVYTLS